MSLRAKRSGAKQSQGFLMTLHSVLATFIYADLLTLLHYGELKVDPDGQSHVIPRTVSSK